MVASSFGDLYLNCSMSPLQDPTSIRPGDVLLTSSREKESWWIAQATGGPYSHAALVVNSSLLFESDGMGVGYTQLGIDRMERTAAGLKMLARLPGVEKAIVLRHPSLRALNYYDLEEILIERLYPFYGLSYPEWSALKTALPQGTASSHIGSLLLSVVNRIDTMKGKTVWNPGPFCSQLVAAVLEDVLAEVVEDEHRRQLFTPPRSSETINPNSLCDSTSNLRDVPGAVGPADPDAQVADDALERFTSSVRTLTRMETTRNLVQIKEKCAQNVDSASRIAALIKEMRTLLDSLTMR